MDIAQRTAEQVKPLPNRPIHWAAQGGIEGELEVLKTRNWITEDLIGFSQKHWHCSREQAVERLLTEAP